MSCCSVAACPNNWVKTKKSGVQIIYHNFPKDSTICELWKKQCKRHDTINSKNARVCSDHFKATDYIDDMQHRLLNLPERKILLKTAVPSLKLSQSTVKKPRSQRIRSRTRSVSTNNILTFTKYRIYRSAAYRVFQF